MRGSALALGLASALVGFATPGLLAEQAPASPARRLEISFDLDGHVTLVAENVTLREVLAEWGRVGGAYMVNADKLPGGPISIMRFDGRPEQEVLDSLLRSAAGYILGPRTARTSGPSLYETVMILPTSTPTATGAYPGQTSAANPFRIPGAPEDEIPPVVPATGIPAPETPAQTEAPRAPAGSPSPGVFVPIVPVTPVTPVTGGRGRGGGGI